MAWLHANRKMLLIGVGVAAVIAIIFGIVAWQKPPLKPAPIPSL